MQGEDDPVRSRDCDRRRRRSPDSTLGIELKVWRDGRPDPLAEGLVQLDHYLSGLGLDSGWLVIFDRRARQPPIEARTACDEMRSPADRRIAVIHA